jgi:hypothetical protein
MPCSLTRRKHADGANGLAEEGVLPAASVPMAPSACLGDLARGHRESCDQWDEDRTEAAHGSRPAHQKGPRPRR